jgi:membrane-anchored glycerophosphoryl diester phosphodiesterase (GDPDase)
MYSFEYFKKSFDCIKISNFSNLLFTLIGAIIVTLLLSMFIPLLPLLIFGFIFTFFLWERILSSLGENTRNLSAFNVSNIVSYIIYDVLGWIINLFNFIDKRILLAQFVFYGLRLYVLFVNPNVLGNSILDILLILLGLFLFFYNRIRFTFALPIRIIKNDDVVGSFKESYELTKGKELVLFRMYLFYYLFAILLFTIAILPIAVIGLIIGIDMNLLAAIAVLFVFSYLVIFNSFMFSTYYTAIKNERQKEQVVEGVTSNI